MKNIMINKNNSLSQLNGILVVGVTERLFIQCEEVSKVPQTEMPLDVFLLVHYATAQCLLMCLPLEHLLFNRPRLKISTNDMIYMKSKLWQFKNVFILQTLLNFLKILSTA